MTTESGSHATLYVGNRNYSSWSMRGSLLIRQARVDCAEELVRLDTVEGKARAQALSPTGKVPVLVWNDLVLWESLAIAEFLAEARAHTGLWPERRHARAVARCVSAEIHAEFRALRERLPMDVRNRYPTPDLDARTRADIARIEQMWTECRDRFGDGGDYLFGTWTAADAMYAPVVTRFRTYGITLGPTAQRYADAVWAWPDMADLVREAEAEPWVIARPTIDGPQL